MFHHCDEELMDAVLDASLVHEIISGIPFMVDRGEKLRRQAQIGWDVLRINAMRKENVLDFVVI